MFCSDDADSSLNIEDWLRAVKEQDDTCSQALLSVTRFTADVGWQWQRTALDSLSSHAFMFRAIARKTLWWALKQKCCDICSLCQGKDESEIPVHECVTDHKRSSKSMEPMHGLEMHKLFKCSLSHLVTCDDSSMKAAVIAGAARLIIWRSLVVVPLLLTRMVKDPHASQQQH